jgi:hypothetical protein
MAGGAKTSTVVMLRKCTAIAETERWAEGERVGKIGKRGEYVWTIF